MNDKLNMHELHSMLVQKEIRLENQGAHSSHSISNQATRKKIDKQHGKYKHKII